MLETQIKVNNTVLNNRLVMPPMATSKSDNGLVSAALCDYYERRAIGGDIGLIITEYSYVSEQGKAWLNQLAMDSEEVIFGMKKLTDIIHRDGTKVIAQINHAGSSTTWEVTGMEIVSASSVINPSKTRNNIVPEVPRELSIEEIKNIEDDFVKSALITQASGFDGVEIHAAHGYLLNQFFSPLTNKRQDKYGSKTVRNRIRIVTDIVTKIREAVGRDYIVAVRLGGCDYQEGGSTIEDAVEASKLIEQAGADLIDISGGMCRFTLPDRTYPGYFSDMSSEVKKNVNIPVIVTGGITTKTQAERLLSKNACDLVGVGRAILNDESWARKL